MDPLINTLKKNQLPLGIKYIVYSYIDLMTLLNKISNVSKTDRNMLTTNSAILDQERCLRIKF